MKKRYLLRKKTFVVLLLVVVMLLFTLYYLYITHSREKYLWNLKGVKQINIFNTDYKYTMYSIKGPDLLPIQDKKFTYTISPARVSLPAWQHHTLVFIFPGGRCTTIYYYQTLGQFFDEKIRMLELSEPLNSVLKKHVHVADESIHLRYGLLIPWQEVKHIFTINSTARIIDCKTGKSFMVQRRAGSSHADVQPLTAQDTQTMKEIYGGRWSWERRSVLVEVKGYRIAASMNGMPHGAGKIQDNNFNGHSCIHFLNSTTHSGNLDYAHQTEILKAGGKLPE